MTDPFDIFKAPMYIMAKAAGPRCNLACRYCYYTDKQGMFANRTTDMSTDMLELFVRRYLEAQSMPQVLFTWHGGEPMLRPLSFYERAVKLQRKYGYGRQIDNCIQTNGTLLTDEWCKFLHDNGWLVGLSIDGTPDMHDRCRTYVNRQPSHARVMRAIEMLDKHQVEWNAMAVVNACNADRPEEFYRFFKDIGCRYLQFAPIVERESVTRSHRLAAPAETGAQMTALSVTPEQWGDFLCRLFDEWVREDVGRIFVQLFDATLANWAGEPPGVCILAPICGHAGVIEHNGDVYSCDHFVFPDYKLGNLRTHTLVEMMYSDRQLSFGMAKQSTLPKQCRECRYLFACNGECPKNRFETTSDGEPGLNYLCRGYHRFFEHTEPHMRYMLGELKAGRAPANIMGTPLANP